MSTVEIVNALWEELFPDEFCLDSFAETLRSHFGLDGEGLSSEDIVKALKSEQNAPWRDIGWACRECFLAFDHEKEESTEFFVAYVAMTCLWANAIGHGQSNWDSSFDDILRLAFLNMNTGSPYWRIRWFGFLFQWNGDVKTGQD
ncbi:MAG: hypothetical protein V4719_13150 [Planctomycetota bacterium]